MFPLPALDKPAGVACRHAGPSGCAVHGEGQPEVCRRYACYWLEHERLPESCRPDRVGFVVTESGTVRVGGRRLPVLVATLTGPEPSAGAGRAMLDGFQASGKAVLLITGADMRIVYDRARCPGIEPEDIEAAFRRGRSRDAEELRRLGAVEDDFR